MDWIKGICTTLFNEPMKNHTSFKIGGAADAVALPETTGQVISLIKACREKGARYTVMGNGSNLLVSDRGFRGVIIKLCKNFSDITVRGDEIFAKSGALLSAIASMALSESLAGLEFASGIPGTVGGAVLMNAGAYGGEMAGVVLETEYINEDMEVRTLTEHEFSYRHSIFQENGGIITGVRIKLQKGERDKIKNLMEELNRKRRDKQPLTLPSAGSAFRRPPGGFAAKLIDDAGLRGFKVGDAQVSEKHTGFIVNTGNATAEDVLRLLEAVKKKVYEESGVWLTPEIKYLKED